MVTLLGHRTNGYHGVHVLRASWTWNLGLGEMGIERAAESSFVAARNFPMAIGMIVSEHLLSK